VSQSDDQGDDRNLAKQYAERYGGSDLDFSLLPRGRRRGLPGARRAVAAGPRPGGPNGQGLFWVLVLVFNVAVAALAIGLMMIAFQGWWDRGLQVTLVGVLAMAYGLFRYYRFREERDGDE